MAADIESLRQQIEEGGDLQTLAETFTGEFKTSGLITRNATSVDRNVLNAAFNLTLPQQDKLPISTATLNNGDQAVITINQVVPGEQSDPEQRKTLAQRLSDQTGSTQFQEFASSLRAETPVVIYSDRL